MRETVGKKEYPHIGETSKASPRVRFVILHHRLDNREHSGSTSNDTPEAFNEHWDLMIEMGDTLATWQLQENPLVNPSAPIAAKRIANHRRAYLDYEGPVSRGRGEVNRVEQGSCEIIHAEPTHWLLSMVGKKLNGPYKIYRREEADWIFVRSHG